MDASEKVQELDTTSMVVLDVPERTPLTPEQIAAHHDHLAECWKRDAAAFGIPERQYPLQRQRRHAHRRAAAARFTSVLRPVRRHAPQRRQGSVVARRRTAGRGRPAARGSDGPGQPGEPSGLAARTPRALSAHPYMPASPRARLVGGTR